MGVQDSTRVLEAETILIGSSMGAEAKEKGRLAGRSWGGTFPNTGQGRRRLRWVRGASCFYPANTHACSLCARQ